MLLTTNLSIPAGSQVHPLTWSILEKPRIVVGSQMTNFPPINHQSHFIPFEYIGEVAARNQLAIGQFFFKVSVLFYTFLNIAIVLLSK